MRAKKVRRQQRKEQKKGEVAFSIRRGMRMSRQGRLLEYNVALLLEELRNQGKILNYVYHEPNSDEDCDGKDFTVIIINNGTVLSRSFGVTISAKSHGEAGLKHPETPQFWWPINTKPETMEKRILGLFIERKKGLGIDDFL